MKLPAIVDSLQALDLPPRELHLAIGMFDGVHLGHQAVIESAIHSARRSGAISGALTFWPHPSRILRPDKPTTLIMPPGQKAGNLQSLGIDIVIQIEFTLEFSRTNAEEFVSMLKKSLPKLTAIYVGENFRFGRKRAGDISMLIAEAKKLNIHVFSIQRIKHNGEDISSTRIRADIANGRIAEANALLGYNYFCEGIVKPGKGLGQKIGYPTLNLTWSPELQPLYGVYAVQITVPGEKETMPGVANYGLRPTVGADSEPVLEIHLLAVSPPEFKTGDTLRVEWLSFLRPEKKFPSIDDLKAQIALDKEQATRQFAP